MLQNSRYGIQHVQNSQRHTPKTSRIGARNLPIPVATCKTAYETSYPQNLQTAQTAGVAMTTNTQYLEGFGLYVVNEVT